MEMSAVTQARMALWNLDLAPRTVVKWLQSSTKLMPTVLPPSVGIARERVKIEEHAVANRGGRAEGAVGVEVLVVHLADAAGDTRSEY